jgi:hypothetical protein
MIINLTPHPINLPSITIHSTGLARVSVTLSEAGAADGIPLVCGSYGAVTGLPEPVEGTVYIVSAMVRLALPYRKDLGSPAKLVRDAQGNIVGCEALEVNP